jgi:Xaa-Pro aminopeptidase
MLSRNDMLLLDSGGQYLDGTTDVTRTIHTGTPTPYQREMFTRVLKGNIGVDSRCFIAGTQGCLLDSYAREHLWSVGKDFIHGIYVTMKYYNRRYYFNMYYKYMILLPT